MASKLQPPQSKRDFGERVPPWVRLLILDLGCCGTSALHVAAPGYGLPGFAGSGYDLVPNGANVLIVAGRLSPHWMPALQQLHSHLAAPRWVISYGLCAISGALFDTPAAADVIPVDLAVPGCPPTTRALARALASLSHRRKA